MAERTAIFLLLAATLLDACGGSRSSPARPRSVGPYPIPPGMSLGLSPANPVLSDSLHLSSSVLRNGHAVSGGLTVTNHSTAPVTLGAGCRPLWRLGLVGKHADYDPAYTPVCLPGPLVIQPGSTTYPLSLGLPAGSSCPAHSGIACAERGLPNGTYFAYVFGNGSLPLPEPAPVEIRVVS